MALALSSLLLAAVRELDQTAFNEIEESPLPAFLKLDPPNCAACHLFSPFWASWAEAADNMGLEGRVWRVDCGVHQDERVFELLDIVRFHAFHYESTPWVFSRATTRKLVGALRYLLKLPGRNQDDVRRFQAELWRDLVMYMGYEHVPNWLRAEFAVLRAGSL